MVPLILSGEFIVPVAALCFAVGTAVWYWRRPAEETRYITAQLPNWREMLEEVKEARAHLKKVQEALSALEQ